MAQPTLEGLPVELHISILFTLPDLNSLWSLILASPTYYGAYQLVQKELLQTLLHKHYAGLVNIADAIAAIRSKGLYAGDMSNKEKIIALLDARRRSEEIRRLGLISGPLPDEPADLQETMQLLRLHNQAIVFLDDYCTSAKRPAWIDETEWNNDIVPLVLSETEKRRILRAFYRLQIHCNIFGALEHSPDEDSGYISDDNEWYAKNKTFSGEEMWHLFFSPMAPWEIEEFGCLWEHCCYRYEAILAEISDSYIKIGFTFLRELPKDQQPPRACVYGDCDDFRFSVNKRESLASKGPALLPDVLREDDFLARRNLVVVNVRWTRDYFYDFDYWPRPDFGPGEVHLLYPADQFDFGTDMDGLRKLLETLLPWERPNLAWERRWSRDDNDFPQLFWDMFEYGADNKHWRWGYAFWENERVIEWKMPMLADDYPFADSSGEI
ncbi:hypothetical protein BO94DRAFT_508705 [Aspergillus sclerotioniger CBS 115572]|uniref:Uncharacterized protein n=1 Tax=Aspergillus sclerotioniger CBS 115572 TaxID=1450535 RepID=A0A317XAK1_9EURO|nr:hypothetical protein BO94DRAFT_508705 [Aspergillus sclerotioniger CBS 115572]PWY95425.1 hypothetical protein BO94DRAFT_508705 [Aspergillus sclerotioniger CBS 115572]